MQYQRKPDWLKIKLPQSDHYRRINQLIQSNNLHTICTSGKCPNMGECWNNGTATFMILGDTCTRGCRFCNVKTSKNPAPADQNEPIKLARAINKLGIKHAVITSVDRDDLSDRGAYHWARTIKEIKYKNPDLTIETLIPDFDANPRLLDMIIDAEPDIISHNLETVKRLTPKIRSKAEYATSLRVLKYLAQNDVQTKSGIMVGLGETMEDILEVMDDLLKVDCKILTIGQYLQPSPKNIAVQRFVEPKEFDEYKRIGIEKGFTVVESGPLVRSSYHAEQHLSKEN
ncbi:Lipoyl synthase [Salinivirga cyanobacteriivorans]|uniref:Lipoyl synthase n=1 Tax=Salinivirga cyanobacteriivorans TaxID=1307839 RepID=A0A0S2I1N9_9BACT|nr:lipoyl synthase [Salinivirga cyanobacteriivorans]ALO16151.1 Lipoyl synthase [Salinivirga cyanobacteriivorans]